MEIEYRTYRKGDEDQLAKVFDRCFSHAAGFKRTPQSILWRYLHRPQGSPEEVQVAEDTKKKKIVGVIFSTIETYTFNNHLYRAGSINDVAVLPEYGKHGIASQLLKRAIQFMESQQCEIATLTAAPKGHARNKMYLPAGWQNITSQHLWLQFTPLIGRYLPLFLHLLPATLLTLWWYKKRMRQIFSSFETGDIKFSIHHPHTPSAISQSTSRQLMRLYNRVSPRWIEGNLPITEPDWIHFRENPPTGNLSPSYVVIRKGEHIIGFATFLREWFVIDAIGMRIPIAIVHEWVLDPTAISPSDIHNILTVLFMKLHQASLERKCAVIMFPGTPRHKILNTVLQRLFFVKSPAGVFMINVLSKNLSFGTFLAGKKPLSVKPGEFLLYP